MLEQVQVDFDGAFPIEGAKEVGTLLTRYASRPLRQWTADQQQQAEQQKKHRGSSKKKKKQKEKGQHKEQEEEQQEEEQVQQAAVALSVGRLRVDGSGRELTVEHAHRAVWR
jgi:uncharacterized protein YlxW (UPF0749 family)